jgi:hypothetical protein
MGKREALGAQLEIVEEQEVDVDRAGAVTGPAEGAAVLGLDRLAEVEQLFGLERGPDPDGGVQEVGLVEELTHRLRLIERGDRLHLDAVLPQIVDRPAQVRLAIADVRAEAEVPGQTPSSSSGSRSMDRSKVTSTPASCTG